ncbi:MAG TPA: ABC transporter substrate-binding protein [Streptosporangiaceae bacterium]|jgi:branched-chain amino acid transport system substrate-binding protein|nr:ABC transporter substrate-binding protein [Streptosporangiaceae bacterium]
MGTPALRRTTTLLATALATALVLAACSSSSSAPTGSSTTSGAAAAAKGTTIKIGLIASLTGPQAPTCDQGATVAPAWAAWINSGGGIDGHPVKTIFLDDKGDPATAQADEKQLASDSVVAIVVSCDNLVSAYDSAAIASGIPLIGGPSDAQDWYAKPGMFPTMTGIVNGLAAQVAVAVKFGHAKKFGQLYCAEVAACGQANPILQAAAKAAHIGYTQLAVSSAAPSYTAQCLQLKQENADYAQLNFTSSAAVRFIQSCQAQGYNPTWGSSEQAIGSAFASIPNLTMYGPAFSFPSVADAPPVVTFRTVMQKYAQGSNWREGTASFTWDGLQALAQAIKDAKVAASAPVTSADVLTGLYGFKGETLGGELANPVTYAKGKPFGITANPCYFVVGTKGGQTIAPAGLTPQCLGKP